MQRNEETARFVATADDGSQHTIIEKTAFHSFQPIGGSEQWIKGASSYQTKEGKPVNKIDESTFVLVMTDTTVRIRGA